MAHSAVASTLCTSEVAATAPIPSAGSVRFDDRQAVLLYRGRDQPPSSPPESATASKHLSPCHPTEEAEEFAQQRTRDGVASVVIRQQPTKFVTLIRDVNHRAPPVLGMIATETMAAAAAAASGTAREWMLKPLVSTLCPPGLEYLVNLDQLAFFDVLLDIPLGTMTGGSDVRPIPRRFRVLNALEQQVYSADMRKGFQASHIETAFTDNTGQTLIMVKIKKASCPYGVCCNCCYSVLDATVEAPPGCTVGSVQQERGGDLSFVVKSTEGCSLRLKARENLNMCCCGVWNINPSWEFAISALGDEKEIGYIKPKRTFAPPYNWRVLTHFALIFPVDLDARMKAALAGAALFLHYYFYGNRQQRPVD